MTSKPPVWLWLSFVLTLVFCGYSLSLRYRAESLNRAVGIVAEFDTVRELAASGGIQVEDALELLKAKGLGGVVLAEETVGDLLSQRRIELARGAILCQGEDQARIVRGLAVRFPSLVLSRQDTMLEGAYDPVLVRAVSVGIDPAAATAARSTGLFVVARYSNPEGAKASVVEATIADAKKAGVGFFLPQGEQVLGRRGGLKTLTESLAENQIFYASPEFTKIGGDANVVEAAPELVIRLHAAQANEIDKLSVPGVVERYVKAASERNQRILFVRPASAVSESPIDDLGNLIAAIAKQVRREGYELGTPHAFSDAGMPDWLPVLIGLSIVPAAFWMFGQMGLERRWAIGLAAGVLLLALLGYKPVGRQPLALVAAMGYPVAGYLLVSTLKPKWIISSYTLITMVSLLGGLCVAGILNGLPFLVKADVFSGVKIAHYVPILVIAILAWMALSDWRAALRSPLLITQLLVGLVVLAGLGFMATRLGNDSPAGVSGAELAFRSLMEQVFPVRPRTKEFLFGHPVMFVALGALSRYWQGKQPWASRGGWIALLLAIGSIGITSVVNTMCHLHTPLSVGLFRILVGWVVGGIIGSILWGVIGFREARKSI